jgi:hypothetical protein
MLASGRDGSNLEDIALQEAERLVKNIFVLGEYKLIAEQNNIDRNDIKKMLSQVFLDINKQLISFTVVLIMNPKKGFREVYIGYAGIGTCYKINSYEVKRLTTNEKDKIEITLEKINKEDLILLCSSEVAEVLDNKLMQRSIVLLRHAEEFCKRIIFDSYNKVGVGNFSAAVYVESNQTALERKKIKFSRSVLLSGIIVMSVICGILINNFALKTKESPDVLKKKYKSSLMYSTPIVINQTPHEVLVSESPPKSLLDSKTSLVKKTNNNWKVNFLTNGSVVMITNWSTIGKDIKYINWEPNKRNKKRIYKYPDYTQIPSSVRIIFKDNSTKIFKIKNN